MQFRTCVKPLPGRKGLITHGEPLLLIGSCFSDNIGVKLRDELFEVTVNPFGPIYNPCSILRALECLKEADEVKPSDLFEHCGSWHSFMFHSRYSADNPQKAAEIMTKRIKEGGRTLREAKVIMLTLGNTKVYYHNSSEAPVANCHKLPGNEFTTSIPGVDETATILNDICATIREVNPDAEIIFTVSPLRYLGDGAHANQIAKATLLLAVDHTVATHQQTEYFPAYEIMMDDLRDYRFYADDMKHPSEMAVNYIYDIFRESYFDDTTVSTAEAAAKLTRRLSHRILTTAGNEAESETNARRRQAEKLLSTYPKLLRAYKRYNINEI